MWAWATLRECNEVRWGLCREPFEIWRSGSSRRERRQRHPVDHDVVGLPVPELTDRPRGRHVVNQDDLMLCRAVVIEERLERGAQLTDLHLEVILLAQLASECLASELAVLYATARQSVEVSGDVRLHEHVAGFHGESPRNEPDRRREPVTPIRGSASAGITVAAMRRKEKVERIGAVLDDLYPEQPIPLDHTDPYTLLVAVALSAQTTDKKVNEVTPALFAEADTPERMVALGPERILEHIRELGLAPTKAKNLWVAANQILDAGGEVLPDWAFLESLAGVGHKTASVVMSQAFGLPAFPVDTHIHRLARRWGLSDGSSVERTERDLKAAFPQDTWNRRHLQIIFFGREYCPALRHDFAGCPICSFAATARQIARERKLARR